MNVIDNRGRVLTPCRRKVAEREVRVGRAKWIGPNRIRLRFDPFAYRYIRLKILERDNHICYWCGNPGDTMDHIVPWSKGGRTTMDNCICACQECNGQRGDMPAEQFAMVRQIAVPRLTGGSLVLRQPDGAPAGPVPVAVAAPKLVAAPKAPVAPQIAVAPKAPMAPTLAPLPMAVGAPDLVAVPRSPAMGRLLDPHAPHASRRAFY